MKVRHLKGNKWSGNYGVMEKIFGEKVTHFSFAWLRAMQAEKLARFILIIRI